MPNRDRRAERREATRQEILAAAWDVARQNGIAGLTLREVAVRVGMQPPSLYSHFESKNAIYDALFAQGWAQFLDVIERESPNAPDDPRERLVFIALTFFDFAMADVPRSQLMNVHVLPDFTPSAESYAVSVRCYQEMGAHLAAIGITKDDDLDLYTALLGGLVSQQQANDPTGTRWRDLVPRAMAMYADQVGVPATRTRKTSGRKR